MFKFLVTVSLWSMCCIWTCAVPGIDMYGEELIPSFTRSRPFKWNETEDLDRWCRSDSSLLSHTVLIYLLSDRLSSQWGVWFSICLTHLKFKCPSSISSITCGQQRVWPVSSGAWMLPAKTSGLRPSGTIEDPQWGHDTLFRPVVWITGCSQCSRQTPSFSPSSPMISRYNYDTCRFTFRLFHCALLGYLPSWRFLPETYAFTRWTSWLS